MAKIKHQKHVTEVVSGETAEDLFNLGFCLPSGTVMIEEALDLIIFAIRRCHK